MQIKSQIFAKEDSANNILYLRVFYDENEVKVGATIHLKLQAEERQRMIGDYYFHDSTIYLKRDSSKHFFKKTKSFGFNWNIIDDEFLSVKNIHLTIDSTNYLFPKKLLEISGQFMNFKQVGFELQKFLPFEIIKQYKITKP
jgi:hypothetical protein